MPIDIEYSERGRRMVSVIIPIYNSEKYLRQCLDSVLSQTYVNYEIIAVNDGSHDFSDNILAEYVEKCPGKIRVISQTNSGVSVARNNGLENANGKYVMFLDSDDYLEKDFLEITVTEAEKNNSQMVVTPTRNVNDKGEFINDQELSEYWRHFDGKEYLIRYNATPRLYLRKFLIHHNIRFSRGERLEDVIFCLMPNLMADRIAMIDYKGYCYRIAEESYMSNMDGKGIDDIAIPYRGLEEAINKIRNSYHNNLNTHVQDDRVLEYCTVRILVTILFVFCKKSNARTITHMCNYCYYILGTYFKDFNHNPYFNIMGEEHVPRFQSMATWLFKVLYRTRLLKPFAILYTR